MKTTTFPYAKEQITLNLPDSAHIATAAPVPSLPDPIAKLRRSFDNPIGTPPLAQLAQNCQTAAIVVSDNTRPVPYNGPNGILAPLIDHLKTQGLQQIKIIVACGTHRPMQPDELQNMLGPAAFQPGVEVINHIATDNHMLRSLGATTRTPNVTINKHYLDAQLKIATGLVEPHFMAGVSGGRKAICPGIAGIDVTHGFHSAQILNHPNARTLLLEGNPCHDEALTIAKMAGVDFIVNVTLDSQKRLNGIFSGHLEKAHLAAVDHLKTFAAIPLDHPYDLALIPAGDVGVNHYQCAKAAFEAARALKPAGCLILTAALSDPDPIGGQNYKSMIKLLKQLGPEPFIQKITDPQWTFTPEQWQAQMWAKTFIHLASPKNCITCAAELQNTPQDLIPESNQAATLNRTPNESSRAYTQRLAQTALDTFYKTHPNAQILALPDGPYAVPVLS